MAPVSTRPGSVTSTVTYSTDKAVLDNLPLALIMGALALVIFVFPEGNRPKHVLAGWMLIVVSVGWVAYAFYRRSNPSKPRVELSPQGVLFRMPGVKEIRIPWREINAVETIDIEASILARRSADYDVTALRISRDFYDRNIHLDSALKRGPNWSRTFIVGERDAKVALHHVPLGVPAEDIREAVEMRWRAFNPDAAKTADDARIRASSASGSGAKSVQSPPSAFTLSKAWTAVKVAGIAAVGVVVFGNLLGYWETEGQRAARIEKEKWQEQLRIWEEEDRRSQEERRKRDKEWKEFWDKHRL